MKQSVILFGLFTISVSCFADSLLNYRDDWLSMSDASRTSYVMGYKNGAYNLLMNLSISIFPDILAIKNKKLALDYENIDSNSRRLSKLSSSVIAEVMTDLYKDPANAYVEEYIMLEIAADKINGKPIEKSLEWARKRQEKLNDLQRKLGI